MTPDDLRYLTPEEREAWERCEAATKGPWWIENVTHAVGENTYLLKYRWDDVPTWLAESSTHGNSENNLSMCAHARTDLPAALERIVEQAKEIERLRAELEGFRAKRRSVDEALNMGDGSYRP